MRLSRLGILVLISLTALFGVSSCGPYNKVMARKDLVDGSKAYRDRKFQEAEQLFRQAASRDPKGETMEGRTAQLSLARTLHSEYIGNRQQTDLAQKALEEYQKSLPQSLNDLAARTYTHQSSVSTVVARLVEQGFVSRQRSAGDSRKLELVLTGRGRRLAARTTGAAQGRLIASIQQIPAESRAQLSALLQRIVGGMNTPARQPRMFFDDTRKRRLRRNG